MNQWSKKAQKGAGSSESLGVGPGQQFIPVLARETKQPKQQNRTLISLLPLHPLQQQSRTARPHPQPVMNFQAFLQGGGSAQFENQNQNLGGPPFQQQQQQQYDNYGNPISWNNNMHQGLMGSYGGGGPHQMNSQYDFMEQPTLIPRDPQRPLSFNPQMQPQPQPVPFNSMNQNPNPFPPSERILRNPLQGQAQNISTNMSSGHNQNSGYSEPEAYDPSRPTYNATSNYHPAHSYPSVNAPISGQGQIVAPNLSSIFQAAAQKLAAQKEVAAAETRESQFHESKPQESSSSNSKKAAEDKPADRIEIITGLVTQMQEMFGMVSGEVFFQASTVYGQKPKLGDKVVVEAEKVTGMPFKYNAKRVQVLSKDLTSDKKSPDNSRSSDSRRSYESEKKEQSRKDNIDYFGPLPTMPSSLNLSKSSSEAGGPLKSILKRNPPPPPILSKAKPAGAEKYRPESPVGFKNGSFSLDLRNDFPLIKQPSSNLEKLYPELMYNNSAILDHERERSKRNDSPPSYSRRGYSPSTSRSPGRVRVKRSLSLERKRRRSSRSSSASRRRLSPRRHSPSPKRRSRSPKRRSRSRSPKRRSRSHSPKRRSSRSPKRRSRSPRSRKRSRTPTKRHSRSPHRRSKSPRRRSRSPNPPKRTPSPRGRTSTQKSSLSPKNLNFSQTGRRIEEQLLQSEQQQQFGNNQSMPYYSMQQQATKLIFNNGNLMFGQEIFGGDTNIIASVGSSSLLPRVKVNPSLPYVTPTLQLEPKPNLPTRPLAPIKFQIGNAPAPVPTSSSVRTFIPNPSFAIVRANNPQPQPAFVQNPFHSQTAGYPQIANSMQLNSLANDEQEQRNKKKKDKSQEPAYKVLKIDPKKQQSKQRKADDDIEVIGELKKNVTQIANSLPRSDQEKLKQWENERQLLKKQNASNDRISNEERKAEDRRLEDLKKSVDERLKSLRASFNNSVKKQVTSSSNTQSFTSSGTSKNRDSSRTGNKDTLRSVTDNETSRSTVSDKASSRADQPLRPLESRSDKLEEQQRLDELREQIQQQKFLEEERRLQATGDRKGLERLWLVEDRRRRMVEEEKLERLRVEEMSIKKSKDWTALKRFREMYGSSSEREMELMRLKDMRTNEEMADVEVKSQVDAEEKQRQWLREEEEVVRRATERSQRGMEGPVKRLEVDTGSSAKHSASNRLNSPRREVKIIHDDMGGRRSDVLEWDAPRREFDHWYVNPEEMGGRGQGMLESGPSQVALGGPHFDQGPPQHREYRSDERRGRHSDDRGSGRDREYHEQQRMMDQMEMMKRQEEELRMREMEIVQRIDRVHRSSYHPDDRRERSPARGRRF